MPSLSIIKYIGIVVVIGVIGYSVHSFWSGYKVLQTEVQTKQGQITQLQQQLSQQETDNKQLVANIEHVKSTALKATNDYNAKLNKLQEKYNDSTNEKRKLESILAKHDFGYLAKNKPELVSHIINSATDKLFNDLTESSSAFTAGKPIQSSSDKISKTSSSPAANSAVDDNLRKEPPRDKNLSKKAPSGSGN